MRNIRQRFGVDYSDDQVRRISVEKLGMNYAKPFVHDYRGTKDAENILPPYSPDLNPMEYIWKSIRRITSITFIKHIDNMRNIIPVLSEAEGPVLSEAEGMEGFYRFSQKTFAAGWVDRFLQSHYNGLCK